MRSDLETVLQKFRVGREIGSPVERGKVWGFGPVVVGHCPIDELSWVAPLWRGWYGNCMRISQMLTTM